MAIRYGDRPPQGAAGPQPVRVLRVEVGQIHKLRMLSPEIGGCMTHYVGKRSRYCSGDDCFPAYHRTEQIYKGYVAAELFREGNDDWLPVVLEVTEHAELDMRQLYRRGQVWQLSRAADRKGKQGPVRALLIDTGDPEEVPEAFNIEIVLQHLYHVLAVDLRARNPMPPRLVMSPSPASALKSTKNGAQ
jgi:hypothetical protein